MIYIKRSKTTAFQEPSQAGHVEIIECSCYLFYCFSRKYEMIMFWRLEGSIIRLMWCFVGVCSQPAFIDFWRFEIQNNGVLDGSRGFQIAAR